MRNYILDLVYRGLHLLMILALLSITFLGTGGFLVIRYNLVLNNPS